MSAGSTGRPTLINCPACDNKVSIEAAFCPECGQPIKPIEVRPPVALPAILFGCMLGIFLIYAHLKDWL